MLMQEAVNELSRLYRLKAEGKKVGTLINKLEDLIKEYCYLCEAEQMAAEKIDEENS